MNFKQLQSEINKGVVYPIYLFMTKDEYISKSYASLIRNKVVTGDFAGMNVSVFDDREQSVQVIMNNIMTLPVMSDKRVVQIEMDVFGKAGELSELLCAYAQNPCETTVLIVITSQLTEKSALYKALSLHGCVVEFGKLNPSQLRDWIRASFEKKGLKIDYKAIEYMVNAGEYSRNDSDTDTGYFANEIEKIASYVAKGKEVTVEVLKKVLSKNVSDDLFKLSDCISASDIKGATAQLDKLILNKVAPQQIISAISGLMKRIAVCKYLTDRGYSQAHIAKNYNMHPYAVKKAVEAGDNFSVKDALHAILVLDVCDNLIKSGRMDGDSAVCVMVTDITSKTFLMADE